MSSDAPRFEPRTQKELRNELLARARQWLPEWHPKNDKSDFGRALLEIVARLQAEVAQRLNRMPEKNFRGFLQWMGIRGAPARAARLPVVFRMTAGADPILAPIATRLQAQAGEEPVIFETLEDGQLLPGALVQMVGVDPTRDAYYIAPSSAMAATSPEPVPTEWRVKSFVQAGRDKLQLDPQLGLGEQLLLDVDGREYRVTKVDSDIVSLAPALESEVEPDTIVKALTAFAPFNGVARNRQQHQLYIGDEKLLNVEAPVTIKVGNVADLPDVVWEYWGKLSDDAEPTWLALEHENVEGVLTLRKKIKASVEALEIATGVSSRWLRARAEPGLQSMSELAGITLCVSSGVDATPKCDPHKTSDNRVTLEAFANTTPLVLDQEFYPLGREPRLFDTFYLASSEAFSKASANVTVCFEMAEPTLQHLALARDPKKAGNQMLFAVGHDGYLHRIGIDTARASVTSFDTATQPHQSDATAGAKPGTGAAISLSFAAFPPAVFPLLTTQTLVAVTAGDEIWKWAEDQNEESRRWAALGFAGFGPARSAILISLDSACDIVAIDTNGTLRVRSVMHTDQWREIAPPNPGVKFQSIATVSDLAAPNSTASNSLGLVAVSTTGTAYLRRSGNWVANGEFADVDPNVAPVAIRTPSNDTLIVTKARTDATIVAWSLSAAGVSTAHDPISCPFPTDQVGFGVDASASSTERLAILTRMQKGKDKPRLAWCHPFATDFRDVLFHQDPPESESELAGPPVFAAGHVFMPGTRRDVFTAEFKGETAIPALPANKVGQAILFLPGTDVQTDDFVEAHFDTSDSEVRTLGQALALPGQPLFTLSSEFSDAAAIVKVRHFRRPASHTGTRQSASKLKLVLATDTAKGDVLVIKTPAGKFKAYKVDDVDTTGTDPIAKVNSTLPGSNGSSLTFWSFTDPPVIGATVKTSLNITDDAQRAAMKGGVLYSSSAEPARLAVLAVDDPNKLAVLEGAWTKDPQPAVGPFDFLVTAAQANWQQSLAMTITSPVLSWEYWDGRSWLTLPVENYTHQLVQSGHVKFEVPASLQPTDVAGKTSHWIRARLIAGDYGQEIVSVETDPGPPVKQTVVRDTSGLRPPRVLGIDVIYEAKGGRDEQGTLPQFVFTLDSGELRNQSDANRTRGAVVEAFVPLAMMLARLHPHSEASDAAAAAACECDPCKCEEAALADQASANVATAAGGRALYLGIDGAFDRPLTTGAIRLLMLVAEERLLEDAFPLSIEILRGSHFEPAGLTVDGTRGLSESGLLSFTLARAPTRASLFGTEAYWLRVLPNARMSADDWQPYLRAGYLNGAFALATETQELELVGSSDGSPGQHLKLARAPVALGSLELRIREPLGEEEAKELLRNDATSVRENIGTLRGPWVRWTEVTDPLDRSSQERVFALDHETGEIEFGTGLRGRIPPADRDNVLAVRYQRAGGEAANSVQAWGLLNLVTPLAGVEEAFAPEAAAGGSDPEAVALTLRFGPGRLRHRDRAVSPRDLEQLALQFSPLVAQARSLASPDGISLIVVGVAGSLTPSLALRRELKRFLLERASPELTRPRALEIEPPQLVPIRLVLKLVAGNIDGIGQLGTEVKKRVTAFFDPLIGGADGSGWQLGERPMDFDLAAQLDGLDNLAGVASIEFSQVAPDGSETSVPEPIGPKQLVCLAPDGIELEFEQAVQESAV